MKISTQKKLFKSVWIVLASLVVLSMLFFLMAPMI